MEGKAIPAIAFRLEEMTQHDVAEVGRVERRCFNHPWPVSAYRRELRNRRQNYYVVVRAIPSEPEEGAPPTNGHHGPLRTLPRIPLLSFHRRQSAPPNGPHVAGFGGMWISFDEAHITTVGVDPLYRGRGFGELILVALIEEAARRGASWMTLEVRMSNEIAQALYRKYGFDNHGFRRRYYSDNGEDALIMWSPSLRDPGYLAMVDGLREVLLDRIGPEVAVPPLQPRPWIGAHERAS